jgi:hypothetical protein
MLSEKLVVESTEDTRSRRAIIGLLYSYFLQKRYNKIAEAVYNRVLENSKHFKCRVEEWIDFIVSAANLINHSTSDTTALS